MNPSCLHVSIGIVILYIEMLMQCLIFHNNEVCAQLGQAIDSYYRDDAQADDLCLYGLNLCLLGNFCMLFLSSAAFFQNQLF